MNFGGPIRPKVLYPDSFEPRTPNYSLRDSWVALLKANVAATFRGVPDVFVAEDMTICADRNKRKARARPDLFVAFGRRPPGDRGAYRVWDEGGVFPQVVFNVHDATTRPGRRARGLLFHERYGCREYYEVDLVRHELLVCCVAEDGEFGDVRDPAGFVSPRLGLLFERRGGGWIATPQPRTFADVAAENARLREMCRAAGVNPDAPPA